jgi:hypothetical protein
MPLADPTTWSDYLRRTLACYDEKLLRQVAGNLIKPRSQWPAEELIERSVALLSNAAGVDRRLQALDEPARKLLTCIGHSLQPRWKLGNLLEILAALGCAEGPQTVIGLFEAGLLCPDLLRLFDGEPGNGQAKAGPRRLRTFEQWLGQASVSAFAVFAHPDVLRRARGQELGLPQLESQARPAGGIHEADGLEWPLRLAALWQQTLGAPLRRTQQGEFFKRDLDRLRSDPFLNAPPAENLAPIPDVGLLAVALAHAEGVLECDQHDLRAALLPAVWEEGLPATLASLWASLPLLENWNPRHGWANGPAAGNPYPSAYLLVLLLLAQLKPEAWARPEDLEAWLLEHHPYWSGADVRPGQRQSWLPAFVLGLAHSLRLVLAAKDAHGKWLVRLSPSGRWLLGLAEAPSAAPAYAQTLLVQPNLEIVVYRQGLTPALISKLSRFATWKNLGAACTLQFQADTVYRALESGLSFDDILQTLEQHGRRSLPPAVLESLRTWANKRERISVYPATTLFEFGTADELNEALARGLAGVRISERLLAVAGESAIDFRHFRLTGTRDYSLPPEKCVQIDADGITLAVDLTRSDLLLETELHRFAEPLDGPTVNGQRRYRLTPASLAVGKESGLGQHDLEDWFFQRSGQALTPAALLLLNGAQLAPLQLRKQLVLHVETKEVADGLLQWPHTRALIRERVGPTALVVDEPDVPILQERLAAIGTRIDREEKPFGGDV